MLNRNEIDMTEVDVIGRADVIGTDVLPDFELDRVVVISVAWGL